jgi:hypothetical protein
MTSTSLNLIQTDQPEQRSVDEFTRYACAGAGARPGAKREVGRGGSGFLGVEGCRGGGGREPAFRVERCGGGTPVVGV